MKRPIYLALATIALFGFTNQQTRLLTNDDARKVASEITRDVLKDYLTFIADDALQGRNTPSPGLDAAANFIAYNLKTWGAKPGGDNGTYFQNIRLEHTEFDKTQTRLTVGNQSFTLDKDFLLFRGKAGIVSAPLLKVDKKLANYHAKGKIVVLSRIPVVNDRISAHNQVIEEGAIAVISDSNLSGEAWTKFVASYQPRSDTFHLPISDSFGNPTSPISIAMTPRRFKQLEALAGMKATISISAKLQYTVVRNIIAIVPGNDLKLRNEYVAFGAHYDHIGMNSDLPGPDKIFNGADDDGSGTVALMNIAKAALGSQYRPKRSMLFVWHCGEEKGLWGSYYFNRNLTVPNGSIVAQLNLDMVGRSRKANDKDSANRLLSGENEVFVIGPTRTSRRLSQIVDRTNAQYLKLGYNKLYDALDDQTGFFFLSDQASYAKNGIPVCFWYGGDHSDYHQVSDELSKIDFTKLENVARTVYMTGVAVANEPTRPPFIKRGKW